MRSQLATFLMLGLCACQRDHTVKEEPRPVLTPEITFPAHFKAAWVMSSGWYGYMGVAIAITEDRYYYWMYSDAGGQGNYPYTGAYTINQGVLRLGPAVEVLAGEPMETPGELHLYSNAWKMVGDPSAMNLHSVGDKADDHARTLVLDVHFDPHDPFKNQKKLRPPKGP